MDWTTLKVLLTRWLSSFSKACLLCSPLFLFGDVARALENQLSLAYRDEFDPALDVQGPAVFCSVQEFPAPAPLF